MKTVFSVSKIPSPFPFSPLAKFVSASADSKFPSPVCVSKIPSPVSASPFSESASADSKVASSVENASQPSLFGVMLHPALEERPRLRGLSPAQRCSLRLQE